MACTSRLEHAAREAGFTRIAGFDEAGRGCLFGPVYAAAVILDPDRPVPGLNDSKQLPAARRESLAVQLRERALAWTVAKVEAGVIDRINIYQASRLAMKLALEALHPQPDYLLVDALRLDTSIEQKSVIRGDTLSHSIAAASILAKVSRDEALIEFDRLYPGYGLAGHKGYGTPEHIAALSLHGPTPHHRRTFAPVREVLSLFPES